MSLSVDHILIVIIAIAVGFLILTIGMAIINRSSKKDIAERHRENMRLIIEELAEDSFEEDQIEVEEDYEDEKPSLIGKWNEFWGANLSLVSSVFSRNDSRGGMFALCAFVLVAGVTSILVKNVLGGVAIGVILLLLAQAVFRQVSTKKEKLVREQLTGFLSAIKANVVANETPERSFSKVIGSMPSPLYDELEGIQSQLLSNISFTTALTQFRDETENDDLRFFSACMISATKSGTSLESQLDTILESVEERRRITEEISQAVKPSNLAIYLCTIIISVGAVASYILSDSARDYWFVNPQSWIALFIVIGLYLFGIRRAKKFVRKVEEL